MKTFTVTLVWFKNQRITYHDIQAEDISTACELAKEKLLKNNPHATDAQVSSIWSNV